MTARNVSYTAAVEWIAANDDTSWLLHDKPSLSRTAMMVAVLYEVPNDRIIDDLTKARVRLYGAADVYEWIQITEKRSSKVGDFWTIIALVPEGETDPRATSRIAWAEYSDRTETWQTEFYYPHSKGHKHKGKSVLKSPNNAKRFVEKNLAKFEQPPFIKNPFWQPKD